MARTTSLNKIESAVLEPTFYKVIQGGTSAGKTFAIMTLLIGYAESFRDRVITVVGMSFPHLAGGAIRDFQKIMREQCRWDDERWNKTEKTYYFSTGTIIEFIAVDKLGALGRRRDVLFVNEANGITYEVFDQLAVRTNDFCIIDYNPSSKFWAHEELVEKSSERTSFLILTYADNEALLPQVRENIESHRPKPGEEPSNWWTVYGLGQIGSLEGNIYQGWVETPTDEIIKRGRLVRYGLDFGFSNDETGLLAIYELEASQNVSTQAVGALSPLGIVELGYETDLVGSQYADFLKRCGVDPSVLIIADAARPEIIAEIKNKGYRIIGADKNPGSVIRGLDRVKARQIYFNGKNLKQEYLSYAWRRKRDGETIDEPQDGNDHLLDALRYAIDDLGQQKFDF